MLKKLKLRSLQAEDTGVAVIFTIIAIIIGMVVFIWLISSIASMIIPLAIFLILAIVFILLIKKVLFGGESLGVIKGLAGMGREAGKETLGLMDSAERESEHRKKRRER